MRRFVLSAALAATLVVPSLAVAEGIPTLPVAAPPPATNAAASSIFDAFIALGRAAAVNPRAAQSASFPYTAALQQYASGQYDQARASAIQSIAQSGGPALPPPTNVPPNVSSTSPANLPLVTSVREAEMEQRLALARRALSRCGPTTGATYQAAVASYQSAAREQISQHPKALSADVDSVVNGCAAAPTPSQPLPAPSAIPSGVPSPQR